jgi:hypothetical protein
MIRKKIVYVDSGNQLTSSTNIWNAKLDINFQEDYDRITVLQAMIPVSYYVIGVGANTFTLKEGSTSIVITISPANYNVFNFATIVGGLMTTNSPNGYIYTITYPNNYTQPDTGIFTYSVNSIANTVSLIFPAGSPIADQFGFFTGSTNIFSISGSNQIIQSTAVVNFIPENSLMIHSNICDGETTSNLSDVLITIYGFNVQPYSTITYVNPCPLETSRRLASRDRNLIFSITDENNNFISMNGQNIQLTLMFYKEETINKSIEQYIGMKTKLLELDLQTQSEKESENPIEDRERKIEERLKQLEESERKFEELNARLDAREETLKIREESINNLQSNKDETTKVQQNQEASTQVEETNSNIENRPQDQAEVSNDRQEEILDQGRSE